MIEISILNKSYSKHQLTYPRFSNIVATIAIINTTITIILLSTVAIAIQRMSQFFVVVVRSRFLSYPAIQTRRR